MEADEARAKQRQDRCRWTLPSVLTGLCGPPRTASGCSAPELRPTSNGHHFSLSPNYIILPPLSISSKKMTSRRVQYFPMDYFIRNRLGNSFLPDSILLLNQPVTRSFLGGADRGYNYLTPRYIKMKQFSESGEGGCKESPSISKVKYSCQRKKNPKKKHINLFFIHKHLTRCVFYVYMCRSTYMLYFNTSTARIALYIWIHSFTFPPINKEHLHGYIFY